MVFQEQVGGTSLKIVIYNFIQLVEGLKVSRAKGLTKDTCHTFYSNLKNVYTQHKYASHHIWNSNETRI